MKIIGPILPLLANTFLQNSQQIFSLQQCLNSLCHTQFYWTQCSSADKNRSENLGLNADVRSDIVSDHVVTVAC